jgi:hypothetical protein
MPIELGDDWMCNETGYVTGIHFWISTYEDIGIGEGWSFSVNIYDDDRSDYFSHPAPYGGELWHREFYYNDTYTVTGPFLGDEGWIIADDETPAYYEHNHQLFWRVDMENISDPFLQHNGTIYWLTITASTLESQYVWGLKTSNDHFMDDAVAGIAEWNEVGQYFEYSWHPLNETAPYIDPLDFAFVITSEPAPEYGDPTTFPDAKMHFPQYPDPYGWDVAWLTDIDPTFFLADDWLCTESGNVTDIHFWLSWHGDINAPIPYFGVEIWSNNPGQGYSYPDTQLWYAMLNDTQFNVIGPYYGDEGWCIPDDVYYEHDHRKFWRIDIEIENITEPFYQENGKIYWLLIRAPLVAPAQMGWKTTELQYNFMDNAVYGGMYGTYPLYDPITMAPLNLAFVITGEPEEPEYGDNTTFPNAKMHFPQYPDPYGWDVDWCSGGGDTEIVWDNGMNITEDTLPAQYEPAEYGELGVLADDFQFDETTSVTDVHWIGVYWNGEPLGGFDWNITFYNDDGTGTGPGTVFAGMYNFTNNECNEQELEVSGYYNCTVYLPDALVFQADTKYWVAFRSYGVYPPQAGMPGHTGTQLHELVFKSEFFGYPTWTDGYDVWGLYYDLPFQLTASSSVPVVLADDWQCNFTGNVTDIHYWISSYNDALGYQEIYDIFADTTSNVYIGIFSNNATPPSHPDEPLLIGQPTMGMCDIDISGPYYGDEGWLVPPDAYEEHNHGQFWRIDYTNFTSPFYQENGTIYWLAIWIENQSVYKIGWKTSQDHWNDNAVFGGVDEWYELYNPLNMSEPIDLAFVITGEPYELPQPNRPPNVPTNESPANNSDYVLINSYLSVIVTDPDGDPMDVVFYWANGTEIGVDWGVASGGTASIYIPDYYWMSHDIEYSWYVIVYDTSLLTNISGIWNFTTCKNYDLNGDGTVNYLDISLLVSHYGENIPDATQHITLRPIADTIVTWTTSPPMPAHFLAVMEIIPDDPNTFVFENPPAIGPELFFVNAPSYTYTIINVTLNARMSSIAGGGADWFLPTIWDGMSPFAYDIPTLIMTPFPIFQTYPSSTWIGDPYGGDWTWAKLLVYHFGVDQTGVPFVSSTMMTQFYLDVYYSTPGSESYDINGDGIVNYLDVSSLVSHYGESY